MQPVHYPVMARDILANIPIDDTRPGVMIDCTLGEGGHTELFLESHPKLSVIGVDRDRTIQNRAVSRLEAFGSRFKAVNSWYDDFFEDFEGEACFILFDLGISTYHFELSQRGFSFLKDEELDMRLDVDADLTAFDVVNRYREEDLADLIYKYGEERYSRRIAQAICRERARQPIRTSKALAYIIGGAVPVEYRNGRIHPATRTFQAIRIEVNNELGRIERALEGAIRHLEKNGYLAVISFHSLEDRPVKWLFRKHAGSDGPQDIRIITRHPLEPSEQEMAENSASHSAKLRIVQKI